MKKCISFLLILLFCAYVKAQNDSIPAVKYPKEIEELNKNLKPATKDYGYGPLGNALLQQLSEPTDNGTRSYTGETAKAGWGSSIWDKNNWYYPGMNLEESRKIARQAFWVKTAKISGIITICALLIAIAVSLYKR